MFNPALLRKIKQDHNAPDGVVMPSTLAFILFDGAVLREKPFACIAFEDIGALRERVRSCLPAEWNLERWNIPNLANRDYWRRWFDYDKNGLCKPDAWDNDNGGMIQNCWHIPFRR